MPAINVARTDTFEAQRQKINQIGSQVFSITQGGSDLATGNLKLGDGTRTAPSLAFTSDPTLGIYKPEESTFGYVASGKKISNFSSSDISFFKDFKITQSILTTDNTSILDRGQNYDPGTYQDLVLVGGTGDGGTATVTIVDFSFVINSTGSNYNEGSFSSIPLDGGSGTGVTCSFTVEGLDGSISDGGSGYVPGNYDGVSLTGGSGTGATANISVTGEVVYVGTISNAGSNYVDGSYTNIQLLNQPTQTFVVTVVANPGTPPPDNVYQIDGVTQPTLNLEKGNTYKFDVSDSSLSGHPFIFEDSNALAIDPVNYSIINKGSIGTADAAVYLIVKEDAATETIYYDCASHDGMGSDINIISGTIRQQGTGIVAAIEVLNGSIDSINFTDSGQNYKQSDVLEISPIDIQGGSGFQYTINSLSYTGVVSSVTIVSGGVDYLQDEFLSANTADIGGFGSGFSYQITTKPGQIQNFSIIEYGDNYTLGDTLSLSNGVTNLSVNLNGTVLGLTTTLDTNSKQILVSSTAGIVEGMVLSQDALRNGDIGVLALNTTVISVDSSTQLTISEFPTVSGAATIDFVSLLQSNIIEVSSLSGIVIGSEINQVSGSGVLGSGVTIQNIDTANNLLTLSQNVVSSGDAVVNIIPPYGLYDNTFQIEVNGLGVLDTFTITSGGNGYSDLDQLTFNSRDLVQEIVYAVKNENVQLISFAGSVSSAQFSVGDLIKFRDGFIGTISPVSSSTDIIAEALQTYSGVTSTSSAFGVSATFDVTRDANGTPFVLLSTPGHSYQNGDVITIPGNLVGGSSPTDDITFTAESVILENTAEIYEVNVSGSTIDSILVGVGNSSFSSGSYIILDGDYSASYELGSTGVVEYRYFIDYGNGYELTPNFSLYVGNKYTFDLSDTSNASHQFALSAYRDGIWGPSYIQNIQTTLDTNSKQITVASTSGILAGMDVIFSTGSGSILTGTTVESIDSATQLTLSDFPTSAGISFLDFRGKEYTESVQRTGNSLTIQVTENTPNLYYYCNVQNASHANEGGTDNNEALITIDSNNPKVFGTGILLSAVSVNSNTVISGEISNGNFESISIQASSASFETVAASSSIICDTLQSTTSIKTSLLISDSNLLVSPSTTFSQNVAVSSSVTIAASSGNITTSGVLKTTNSLNINDALTITNSSVASTSGNDVLLSPATGRVAKVNTNTALIIPSGTSAERPTGGVVENGAIRYNTESGQYEGYSATTTSWSSLGGVRDLDGNTYIAAEASVGANDNTLYFFNDGNNTVSVTPNYLQFVNVKKVRSVNTTAPAYTDYTTNTQVTLGQYLKYRNNIYEVTVAGQTGTSGNEPTHTTGAALNGTAELTWYASAVAPLTFEEIEEVRIDPLGFTDLVVNNELRFSNNVISTDLQDLIIRPNAGKKITLDATSSLVVPVGDINQRGVAAQGSIRYNTTISQYEGYDGSNWTSLGGVKDVDGNTYIIPELSPGSNENVLFFYNDGVNTMRLSTNSLEFTNIDAITSQNNNLDIEAQTVTFNGLAATIDTSGTSTFISTTKDNLDLGLAVGLNVDPLLRLDINGDIYLNKAFGTGSFDGLKLFNSDLSSFELSDFAFTSDDIELIKGGTNSGASVLYDPSTQSGAKVTVSVVNQTTGDKEMIEYQVIDKGSDIFHTDIGNLKTGNDLVTSVFDFDANNNVRVTFTLDTNMTVGDVVNITVVKHVFKK